MAANLKSQLKPFLVRLEKTEGHEVAQYTWSRPTSPPPDIPLPPLPIASSPKEDLFRPPRPLRPHDVLLDLRSKIVRSPYQTRFKDENEVANQIKNAPPQFSSIASLSATQVSETAKNITPQNPASVVDLPVIDHHKPQRFFLRKFTSDRLNSRPRRILFSNESQCKPSIRPDPSEWFKNSESRRHAPSQLETPSSTQRNNYRRNQQPTSFMYGSTPETTKSVNNWLESISSPLKSVKTLLTKFESSSDCVVEKSLDDLASKDGWLPQIASHISLLNTRDLVLLNDTNTRFESEHNHNRIPSMERSTTNTSTITNTFSKSRLKTQNSNTTSTSAGNLSSRSKETTSLPVHTPTQHEIFCSCTPYDPFCSYCTQVALEQQRRRRALAARPVKCEVMGSRRTRSKRSSRAQRAVWVCTVVLAVLLATLGICGVVLWRLSSG